MKRDATTTNRATKRFVDQFRVKDGMVRKKTRFILGFAATGEIGGTQFSVFAPTEDALHVIWLKAMSYPLDTSKVQAIAISKPEGIS